MGEEWEECALRGPELQKEEALDQGNKAGGFMLAVCPEHAQSAWEIELPGLGRWEGQRGRQTASNAGCRKSDARS